MKEYLTKIEKPTQSTLENAARLILDGGIAAVPTETVYGLAANAYNGKACDDIFKAKGRPQDNPLIIHICDLDMLERAADDIPPLAYTLAENFWSGPLTMIFRKKDVIPSSVTAGLDTVAVRMPQNDITLQLIRMCGVPLAAPSANLSGKPSPTSAMHVYNDLNGRIPLIIDGGECAAGVESTVICFTDSGSGIKILRPGAVTPEMLSRFADTVLDKTVFQAPADGEKIISPGVKYRHYSPKAEIILVEAENERAFADFINSTAEQDAHILIYGGEPVDRDNTLEYGSTPQEQAHNIFSVLRTLDERNVKKAYVRAPINDGIGIAVYNRLLRAAAFRVIKL